ncbi:radical SAM protein [Vulcanisaeta souniana]|uniref:radical SAM protein n=1 Tax=Vulcanisaeta souniana TaxID=164452 RepID=UPI000A9B635A|nr:radical SAM protein [Vulcanisaeta souniana]
MVVGGPAGWQITDTGKQRELGVDVVYEGEFEEDGPQLFDKLIKGEPAPERFVAHRPVPVDIIPTIATPSIGGMVEVTRGGCGRGGCQFCTPTLSGMIRSIPFEGHIDREIKLNIEVGGFEEITLHSEEFFRYGAKGIEPNPEKVLDLTVKAYKLVKSYGDNYELTTDFTTAAVVKYAPKMVKEVSEYMNEGGTWHFIEMGIETGSPRLLRMLMAGKALPYKPEQYPDVVEEAIGILNDNHWVVVGTMILNLPGETDDDVIKSLELLDRISKLRVLTFPLPFIPMGALRKRDFTILDRLLEDPLRREFILKAFIKSFEEAKAFSSLITRKVENFIVKRLIGYIAVSSFNLVLKRYKEKLGSLIEQYGGEFRERIKEEVNRASVSIRLHDDFNEQ